MLVIFAATAANAIAPAGPPERMRSSAFPARTCWISPPRVWDVAFPVKERVA